MWEFAAVAATGIGKFVFMDWLEWKFPFILAAMGGWLVYILIRVRRQPGLMRYWGFTRKNFKKAFLMILPFALATVIGCFLLGFYLGTNILSWHILPLLLLYPLWGTVQQFLMVGLVAGNLYDRKGRKIPLWLIVAINSVLFSVVHYPSLMLMGGTLLLAILYSVVYLKTRNLYVLGIFHGWLGALFYYTVLGRDSFLEVFGPLFQ